MTYRELFTRLTPLYELGEAQAIVRMVLDIKFGLSYTDIVCGKVNDLSAEDQQSLEEIMVRLEKGEPVQYILGAADFDGRTFHVEAGVLIPRPETEELIPLLAMDKPYRLLDIGTGSGCIAISAALDYPQAKVTAWDISEDALRIAQGNAKLLEAEVTFEKRNALAIEDDGQKFDIIVSNPPYIAEKEAKDMSKNVLDYEPEIALFVPDDDPLKFYRAIAEYGTKSLNSNGQLLFEINPLYAKEMEEMLDTLGYQDIELIEDQFGKLRFSKAVRK